MKFAVLLGRGRYEDELTGFGSQEGPRPEFVQIARVLDADIISYTSEAARRGKWFKTVFMERPQWGSAFAAALKIGRYDRIYVTGEDIGLRLGLFASIFGVNNKIVTLVHNFTKSRRFLLKIFGHNAYLCFVTVSFSQKKLLLDAGIPEKKIFLTYNWVDEKYFSPVDELEQLNFVACGAENRDYPTLKSATLSKNLECHVYGHGFFGDYLGTNHAESEGGFQLKPRVPFSELRFAYGASMAVVVPLNNVNYAAGVTGLVEAYAMGKSVIASKSVGLSEYLENSPGALVTANDPEALADAMLRMSKDDIGRAKDGARNRAWVVENCSLDKYAEDISNIMKCSL